jgi:enamine deaminase RidA (YjgF/YER057c/UK114 family)
MTSPFPLQRSTTVSKRHHTVMNFAKALKLAAAFHPAVRNSTFNLQTVRHAHGKVGAVESHMTKMGIVLPPAPQPKANYALACRSGDLLYLSGHLPILATGSSMLTGVVGGDKAGTKTTEEGYEAARLCGLNLIATLKKELGDLDRVDQVVKMFGIVNSDTAYKDQPAVMNGASDLFIEVFGKEKGYHARSAIGVNTLPFDVSVEVEAIFRIKD